jgi:uncharacterized protein (TIGR02246 family)
MRTQILAAATALTVSGPTLSAEGTPPAAAKIQSTIDAMTSAFAAGDIDGIMSTYEPGAVVVGEPGMPVTGTPALREMFARFIALDPKFTFIDHEVVEAGDIALHLNTWKMEGRLPDGTPVEQGGLSAAVLRKQADGRWLMVIDNPYGDHIMGK